MHSMLNSVVCANDHSNRYNARQCEPGVSCLAYRRIWLAPKSKRKQQKKPASEKPSKSKNWLGFFLQVSIRVWRQPVSFVDFQIMTGVSAQTSIINSYSVALITKFTTPSHQESGHLNHGTPKYAYNCSRLAKCVHATKIIAIPLLPSYFTTSFFFFIAKKGRPVKASKEEKVDKRRGLVVTKPKIVNSSKQGKTTGLVTAKV